jgi:hypothetical protein
MAISGVRIKTAIVIETVSLLATSDCREWPMHRQDGGAFLYWFTHAARLSGFTCMLFMPPRRGLPEANPMNGLFQ